MNRIQMRKSWLWAFLVGAGLGVGAGLFPAASAQTEDLLATPSTKPAAASPMNLEDQAFAALKNGDFHRSSDLLAAAATTSGNPKLGEMADWTQAFDKESASFAAERHQDFLKAVADVHLLMDHHLDTYALDEAVRAFLRADDQTEFSQEPWIKSLVTESATAAQAAEDNGQWEDALRIYSDLVQVEPADSQWKDKLKVPNRSARLLLQYTPKRWKNILDTEAAARKPAEDLVRPATQPARQSANASTQPADGLSNPTTHPALKPGDAIAADDSASTDWREIVKGVKENYLVHGLELANDEYFRNVSYTGLLTGGLNGVRALATTNGLQDAFPGLADKASRDAFIAKIDSYIADVKKDPKADQILMTMTLMNLKAADDNTVKIPDEVLYYEFADGAFGTLDPFSTMIWPDEVADFNKSTQGEFGGVGIQIENDAEHNIKVVSPIEGTPAYNAGIHAGDVIIKVEGRSAKEMSLDAAVRTITGAVGTQVHFTVRQVDGTIKEYTITRQIIKVDSVRGYTRNPNGGGWNWFADPSQKIAYIRLSAFTQDSADDMDTALREIKQQGGKAIILDLRYNPGGLLQTATDIVNKFVDHGVIVSTHPDRPTSNDPTETKADPDKKVTNLPVAVLVNQFSASASEILSGALKDDKRALIVGERTYGKGSVQVRFRLDDNLAYMKLTTAHYYLPSGRCIHREEDSTTWGVDPDITVAMTPEQMRAAIDARQDLDVLHYKGETVPTTKPAKDLISADPQLAAALLVLKLKLAGGAI